MSFKYLNKSTSLALLLGADLYPQFKIPSHFQPEADPPLAEWGGLGRGVKTKKRVDFHHPLDPLPLREGN